MAVKYDTGYAELERLIEAVETARTSGEIEAGSLLVFDARALVLDLASLAQQAVSPEVVAPATTTVPVEASTTPIGTPNDSDSE
jgi:hypothetical protein